ncbi:uncharacterized protein BDR25DRAFT_360877 [Lindgomyces ingoldianus]|uniref:Uncharacterized protein n=1 Tax=Lindgomyces ingoldianus TaxID=673940 RepID=A0ACB6QEB4_9PLEO|nr:uncharacterized protein BDR25DRAFT_360877 [Lindgomyces ingoldianus]KAF2465236.1 hypothetical protein BDR25DRAFT_360877 [Lindgomyces ingoldianus]
MSFCYQDFEVHKQRTCSQQIRRSATPITTIVIDIQCIVDSKVFRYVLAIAIFVTTMTASPVISVRNRTARIIHPSPSVVVPVTIVLVIVAVVVGIVVAAHFDFFQKQRIKRGIEFQVEEFEKLSEFYRGPWYLQRRTENHYTTWKSVSPIFDVAFATIQLSPKFQISLPIFTLRQRIRMNRILPNILFIVNETVSVRILSSVCPTVAAFEATPVASETTSHDLLRPGLTPSLNSPTPCPLSSISSNRAILVRAHARVLETHLLQRGDQLPRKRLVVRRPGYKLSEGRLLRLTKNCLQRLSVEEIALQGVGAMYLHGEKEVVEGCRKLGDGQDRTSAYLAEGSEGTSEVETEILIREAWEIVFIPGKLFQPHLFQPSLAIILKSFISKFHLPRHRNAIGKWVDGEDEEFRICTGMGSIPTLVIVDGAFELATFLVVMAKVSAECGRVARYEGLVL